MDGGIEPFGRENRIGDFTLDWILLVVETGGAEGKVEIDDRRGPTARSVRSPGRTLCA